MVQTRQSLKKVTNENLMFMESLVLFDLWLMIKIRYLMAQIFRLLFPLVKITLIMSVGMLIASFMKNESSVAQITDERSNAVMSSFSKPNEKSQSSAYICNNLIYEYTMYKTLPDFASEASGAMVIETPDTETYHEPNYLQLRIFGMPVWKAGYYSPRKVIQPWTETGECWAFHGSRGKIVIEMAYEIFIEKVTLEHIPISAALTGRIDSAPKSFNVLAKVNNNYVIIGTYAYDDEGPVSQTFEIKKAEMKTTPIKIIMLEILSNYGHPHYTCIYRFRVHGKIYSM